MASLPESRIPGPAAGGGGKDKRRSFLPAPKRSSGIPTPGAQPPPPPSAAQASPAEDPVQVLKPPKVAKQEIAREEPKEVVPGAAQLVVGKRVLISGVKPGILRYVGKTHIAPGYWCGVELFDASGLHDGEVDGTRYFSCKSFRGIFAPLDKVVVDESAEVSDSKLETRIQKPPNADSGQAPKLEEKREIDNEAGRNDIQKKSLEEESAASKLPVPGKSQIARLSGIPRVGAGGGVVKSTSVETFTKTEKDAPGHKRTGSSSEHDLNATLTVDRSGTGRVRTVSEDSDADGSLNRTYSCTVEKQLQSDSRRYFNITFNKDTPPKSAGGNGTGNNLPDVVSSASPSPTPPSWDGAGRTVPSVLNQTQSAQDIALALVSDMSLGLMEPDIIADETNLLDGLAVDRVTSSASESDISQSNSSTLDEASVATVAEAGVGMTSTPLQGEGFRKFLEDKGGTLSGSLREADAARSFEEGSTSDVKRNLGPAFSGSPHHQGDPAQRKDSSSSSNSAAADYSFPQKQELLQEEGSNGISPEVSQVLEWDYDHDAFDGGSGGVLREVETDSDVYSEACTTLHDTETEGPSDVDEVEQTEQTATGLETEDSEDDEDEDEDEEVTDSDNDELVDDLPEDDRVEADRSAPSAGGSRTTTAASGRTGVASQPSEAQRSALRVVDEMTESASRLGSEMTESATPGMTENAEPPSSSPDGSADAEAREASGNRGDNAGEGTSAEPAATGEESTVGQVSGESANAGIGEGTQASTPSQKNGKQASAAGGSKKTVVEHKKVNVKATSRLADYINAPLPTKPKEEKKAETKAKKNNAGNTSKANRGAGKNADNSSSNTPDKAKGDEGSGNMEEKEKEKKPTPVKEAKPKVKRLAPKSKWGDIMSQIEANKDTTKVKPKSEIKSSLAVYLSTPATPANTNTNANANNPSNTSNNNTTPSAKKDSNKKEEMSKPRSKLVNHPKADFSNIKSKLNLSIPATPSPNRRDSSSGPAPAANPGTPKNTSAKKPVASKTKQGRMQMGDGRLDMPDTWSVVSQPASSTTDLSVFDVTDTATPSPALPDGQPARNSASRVAPRLKNERPSSVASSRSDHSTPRSVKTMNLKNAQKSDATNTSQSRRSSVKSSIPPPNQSRSRVKSGGQLKSGHPPDVVSTSARGTRAQEVARLESLCETRTKELNYTKMQLKAGLQAFDAMACLLNYCTNQLDAFSCPEVTAKLKVAEGNLSEQQKQIECLEQQKANVEQQLAEVTQARDAALQDVGKLQQEMKAAEEAHQTAVQQLKDDHEAALKSQEDVLHTHHQQKNQQLQRYHEKQMEYALQAHKRQLAEVTAEHNMDTNQLKVAHLEEIQELRNKHDKQMEELHAQHRNKLEDITRRFESIKLSLSEKVESLCKECEDLRIRAKASEDALQRDADVKVQLALTPYLHLPKEIESLKTVVDMRTEEIQKLRRQNMDLEKQLEELPIAQEKVASLQQKVENLQAIINIKTDHEKQLHEKCQVLMRKYDRESRANKRLSMDYEQVMWRMSQSADSAELLAQTLSHSPTRGGIEPLVHGSPSPVRRSMSNNAQGDGPGVTRRQRRVSGGDEDLDRKIRCRSATFVMDKSKAVPRAEPGVNGTGSAPDSVSGSPSKQIMSRSADYTAEIVAALNNDPDDLWSSGQFSDLQSSLEDSVILHTSKDFFETPQGVSYSVMVQPNGTAVAQDKVFEESDGGQTAIADESWVASSKANVTVVVNSPVAE